MARLTHYFQIEPEDLRVFAQPERESSRTGQNFLAMLGREGIGTIGLEREAKGVYAVIKMTVDESYRGLGIGRGLLEHAIEEFERLKGKQLFLETNSKLRPAQQLYENMGFVKQPSPKSGTAFDLRGCLHDL